MEIKNKYLMFLIILSALTEFYNILQNLIINNTSIMNLQNNLREKNQ